MKKMKNKILISILLLILLVANVSFASYEDVTMTVVEEPVCTIELGPNSKFEKKLYSKDLANKEVTLQLKVNNEEVALQPTGEVMIVLDDSDSMKETTSTGAIRKDLVYSSAQKLVENMLKDNENLKVGVVSFSTSTETDETTGFVKEGTINDAKLVSELTNDVSALKTAINNITPQGPRTNLESGITLANQYFSKEDNNKYMIILSDGVPNVAIDYDNVYYSDDVVNKTKTKLQSISKSGINVITMLTGIADEEASAGNTGKTFGEVINSIFGTEDSPTVGKFYYINDSEIEKTITDDIYKDLLPIARTLKNIKIVDYFPKEIIDNFEFAYVSKANIGEISAEVNKTNNSITWTIPELASGQTATVQYKLSLKKEYSSSIVDKILNTNEKVDITYTDIDEKPQDKTSDISPKLKLVEPDIAPTPLPATGSPLFYAFFIVSGLILAFCFIRVVVFNKRTK